MSGFRLNVEDELRHFEKIWCSRPAVDSIGCHSRENWDKRAVDWANELESEDSRKNSDERVAAVMEFLQRYGLPGAESDVIDIGCGLGRFTAELAKRAGHATGSDLSPRMCAYGREYAETEGVAEKTSWVDCDFRQIDIQAAGWEKAFDLVFTSLTPALDGIEAVEKLCRMSREYCFNCTFVTSSENVDEYIYKRLTGDEFPQEFRDHHRWFYSLCNILYLKGYLPRADYYEKRWTTYTDASQKSVDYFLERFAMKYKMKIKEPERVGKILAELADSEGRIRYDHHTVYGFILWNVNGHL